MHLADLDRVKDLCTGLAKLKSAQLSLQNEAVTEFKCYFGDKGLIGLSSNIVVTVHEFQDFSVLMSVMQNAVKRQIAETIAALKELGVDA